MKFEVGCKFSTFFLRNGSIKSFFNEHSENLYLSSSFCFKNAYQAEFFFKNFIFYNIYSRFNNPTLEMLQKRLLFLENVNFCLMVSSGMSAIVIIFMTFLKPCDFFVSLNIIFGTTLNFFFNILFKFNIFIRLIDYLNIDLWVFNICFKTKIFFIETPSNPFMNIVDIRNLSYITRKYKILLVVDNTFASVLQKLFFLNVDILVSSCTKFLEGYGRILGGVIFSKNDFLIKKIFVYIRITGPVLSVFNAWLIFKSLESLVLRVKNQCKNILILFNLLKNNYYIFNIFYPGLFKIYIVKSQQILGGGLISFNLKGNTNEMKRINSWKVINNSGFFSITANFGDIRSVITHPSSTTHNSLCYFEKKIMFINESLLRICLGLEDIFDIYNALFLGFKKF